MRERITITISTDVLNQIDQLISDAKFRNRSQAIEQLVKEAIGPTVKTAVILAGRSHGHQDTISPLIKIKGTPLIVHTIRQLQKHHFRQIILCIDQASVDTVKSTLAKYPDIKLDIVYSIESQTFGTGGALKKVQKQIGPQTFLLLHGDIITNIDFSELIDFHHHQGKLATLAIKPRPGKTSYGRIFLQGNDIIDFIEPKKASPISLINTGIYVLNHKCFQLFPKTESFKLEDVVLPKLIEAKQASGYIFQGIWFDVTDPKDFSEANSRWPGS
jgi:NDP-sugar pyrophosphorylase family protein